MLNFKSILYKEKYYAISFKLNFIMKSNLNVIVEKKCRFLVDKTIYCSRSKFCFKRLTTTKYEDGLKMMKLLIYGKVVIEDNLIVDMKVYQLSIIRNRMKLLSQYTDINVDFVS